MCVCVCASSESWPHVNINTVPQVSSGYCTRPLWVPVIKVIKVIILSKWSLEHLTYINNFNLLSISSPCVSVCLSGFCVTQFPDVSMCIYSLQSGRGFYSHFFLVLSRKKPGSDLQQFQTRKKRYYTAIVFIISICFCVCVQSNKHPL